MQLFIIDSDPSCNFFTEQMLLLEGASLNHIHTFLSVKEALDALLSVSCQFPHIILLDLGIQVTDGWEFLEVLAQLDPEKISECHVFVLTSSVSTAEKERAKACPMVSGFLHKPLQGNVVRRLLRDPLESAGVNSSAFPCCRP